jgi:hypothetical protein
MAGSNWLSGGSWTNYWPNCDWAPRAWADGGTALSVGRLVAARMMVAGHLHFSTNQLRVSLRMIDCETGMIRASLSEVFDQTDSLDVVAGKLQTGIISQLLKQYPIRTTISAVRGVIRYRSMRACSRVCSRGCCSQIQAAALRCGLSPSRMLKVKRAPSLDFPPHSPGCDCRNPPAKQTRPTVLPGHPPGLYDPASFNARTDANLCW